MSRELDRLMDMRADEYTPEDIDTIIAYYRKQLAMFEAGVKPKREAEENVDMAAIVAKLSKKAPPAPAQKMKRRM